MYRSGLEIQNKLSQVRYYFRQLMRFENRLFVHGGWDQETQSFPLRNYLCAFVTGARSVLQYAHKEASERGKPRAYDEFVGSSAILRSFRDLRNVEIHEATMGTQSGVTNTVVVDENGFGTTGWVRMYVESLDDLDNPKDRNTERTITTKILKPVLFTPDVIDETKLKGQMNLTDTGRNDSPLYEIVECEGEDDLFKLCRMYLSELERFVEYGKREGFIS